MNNDEIIKKTIDYLAPSNVDEEMPVIEDGVDADTANDPQSPAQQAINDRRANEYLIKLSEDDPDLSEFQHNTAWSSPQQQQLWEGIIDRWLERNSAVQQPESDQIQVAQIKNDLGMG